MRFSVWRNIATLVLFVGFLNLFLFHAFGTVAFSISIVGFFLFILSLFITQSDRPIRRPAILIFGTLILALLLMLVNRDNWFVELILGLSSFTTLILFLYLMSTRIPFVRSLMEIILIPFNLSLAYVRAGLNVLTRLLSQKYSFEFSSFSLPRVKSVIVGFIIALPVIFALVVLLAGADPIYAKFIERLLSINLPKLSDRLVIHLLFSGFWLVVLSPLLLLSRKQEFVSPLRALKNTLFTHEMTVVMGLITIVLGSFLIVQAPYIFVSVPAETDLSKYGVATYSEYVKKGFGEFLFVSLFIYSLIWLGLVFMRGKTKLEKGILSYVQLIVLAEFGIFLLSIFRRIWLYQTYHGWSLVRIYGGFFLVWVTLITTTLALRHLKERKYVIAEFGFTVALILWTGVFNAEHFIATTHPPTVNKRIDYVYLSRMSADGYAGWMKAYEYAKDVLVSSHQQQKELINREERREIVYAGVILGQLTYRHFDLTLKYATPAQLKEYNQTVINRLENQLEYHLLKLETSSNPRTGSPSAELILARKTHELYQSELSEFAELTVQKEQKINSLSVPYTFIPYENLFSGFYTFCYHYPELYCIESFYDIDPRKPDILWSELQPGSFDYWFTWNGSKATTYHRLSKDIPLEQLLTLQEQFFTLFHQISRQPPEERDYDIDISFETPFL